MRGFLKGHGGTDIAYCRWEHASPKGRVVISHGFGEHGERYRHTAHWLHYLGWSVSAMDHKGFGRSGGIRGDADSGIRGYVDDFALFLRQERRFDAARTGAKPRLRDGVPLPPLPVCPQVVLAHSFGALVALLTLLWHGDTLDGLILSSPAVTLRSGSRAWQLFGKLLYLLAPHRPIHIGGDKFDVCSDPILVQRYYADALCHKWATAAFGRAMAEGRSELIPLGAELDRPILVLEAGDDSVADPDGNEALWSAVPSGLLERHRLEGFKHEVFHDIHRPEALAFCEPWLARLQSTWNPRPASDIPA
jgi:alpha-beta hydrolase superfamily lysophospholipase